MQLEKTVHYSDTELDYVETITWNGSKALGIDFGVRNA